MVLCSFLVLHRNVQFHWCLAYQYSNTILPSKPVIRSPCFSKSELYFPVCSPWRAINNNSLRNKKSTKTAGESESETKRRKQKFVSLKPVWRRQGVIRAAVPTQGSILISPTKTSLSVWLAYYSLRKQFMIHSDAV